MLFILSKNNLPGIKTIKKTFEIKSLFSLNIKFYYVSIPPSTFRTWPVM